MRKRTLAGVCTILAFAILFGLRWVRVYFPLGLPPFFVFLVLMPLLMIPATFLNKRLLAWRKSRGRDIAEEEKYELEEADIISLRPRSDDPTRPENDEKHLPLIFR